MNDFDMNEYKVTISERIDDGGYNGLKLLYAHNLSDYPLAYNEINVTELYVTSKLNREECEYLIEKLEEQGIYTSIANTAVPDIKYIPISFISSDEDEDVFNRNRVKNFMEFWLPLTVMMGKVSETALEKLPQYYVRDGIVKGNDTNYAYEFEYEKGYLASDAEIYPLNVLYDAMGLDKFVIPTERVDDFKEAFREAMDKLTEYEQEVINAHYKYNYTIEEILAARNFPAYETLIWEYNRCLNKARRIFRHPIRIRKLKDFACEDEYFIRPNKFNENIYLNYCTFVEENIKPLLGDGLSLDKLLSPYYEQSVINEIKKTINRWCEIPSVSIQNMKLNRRMYYSLKQANIKSLEDLWKQHNRDVDIGDFERTGLKNIYGIRNEEIGELFNLMLSYVSDNIDVDRVEKMIAYAELIALKPIKTYLPDLSCTLVPAAIFSCLLPMKYRLIEEVKKDFLSGKLKERFNEFDYEECEEWEDFYGPSPEYFDRITKQISDNVFPIREIKKYNDWDYSLIADDEESFNSFREAYLMDDLNGYDYDDVEAIIPSYFPEKPLMFDLINGTRRFKWNWIPFSLDLSQAIINSEGINGFVKFSYYGFNLDEKLYSVAIFGENIDVPEDYAYVKYEKNGTPTFVFDKLIMELDCDGISEYVLVNIKRVYYNPLTAIKEIELELLSGKITSKILFEAIELNAELYSDPSFEKAVNPIGDDTAYELLQDVFCDYYIRNCKEESEKEYYENYMYNKTDTYDELISKYRREPLYNPAVEMTIEEMDLSVRSFNCLKRAAINTVGDLLLKSEDDMMKVRNLGKKSLDEIKSKIKALGFDWI